MKSLVNVGLVGLLIIGIVALAGCGGDDNKSTEPTTPTPRVTAATAASAPSSVSSSQWASATATQIGITSISFAPKVHPQTATLATTDSVSVKAMVFSNTLYMRFEWTDATDDHWPRSFYVSGWNVFGSNDSSVVMTYDTLTQIEDQLLFMVRETDTTWDCWNWRRVTTGGGGLAEGKNIEAGTFVVDANDSIAAVAIDNYDPGFGPYWMQPDSSDRIDAYLLYLTDTVAFRSGSGGWDLNQRLAGVALDTTLQSSPARRGSQWDVAAVSSDTGGKHMVVLSRAFNTGHADDVVYSAGELLTARLGVTNNANFSLSVSSTDQGFSPVFELKLP